MNIVVRSREIIRDVILSIRYLIYTKFHKMDISKTALYRMA